MDMISKTLNSYCTFPYSLLCNYVGLNAIHGRDLKRLIAARSTCSDLLPVVGILTKLPTASSGLVVFCTSRASGTHA